MTPVPVGCCAIHSKTAPLIVPEFPFARSTIVAAGAAKVETATIAAVVNKHVNLVFIVGALILGAERFTAESRKQPKCHDASQPPKTLIVSDLKFLLHIPILSVS